MRKNAAEKRMLKFSGKLTEYGQFHVTVTATVPFPSIHSFVIWKFLNRIVSEETKLIHSNRCNQMFVEINHI